MLSLKKFTTALKNGNSKSKSSPAFLGDDKEQIQPPIGGNKVQQVHNVLSGKGGSSAQSFVDAVSSGKLVCPAKDMNYHADGDIQVRAVDLRGLEPKTIYL